MKHYLLYVSTALLCLSANSQDDTTLLDPSFEDLFNMEVKSASGLSESYLKAPASMNVITSKDIIERGYHSLDELLMDVPGFDVTILNGTTYMNGYQRGYRTPFTQRTLIMVNGKIDNHLWTHMANISRQYPINNIEKVEILYGPSSAVYGANAFLGVINIITKDAKDLEVGDTEINSTFYTGSYNTRSVDVSLTGKQENFSYNFGIKYFQSDEEDLSGKYGFISNDLYGDSLRWGALIEPDHLGHAGGMYYDPTKDMGVNGEINFGDLTLGFNNWVRSEAYGPYYAADKAQNNSMWNYSSNQFYADYDKNINDRFSINTSLLYRSSRVWGEWSEATPMWNHIIHIMDGDTLTLADRGFNNDDFADFSFISLSHWNSVSSSVKFTQNFNYQILENLNLSGGFKHESKTLTKAYDIPGYWGAYSSIESGIGPGDHGWGSSIGHSTDETYSHVNIPGKIMPSDNLIYTTDIGGFVQGIYDLKRFRLQAGVRYDNNSMYGSSVNPRVSTTYVLPDEVGAFKLVYGEAFQEPAPIQLFGGWNGRQANPNLLPEKARNLEFIGMFKHNFLFHQLSLYRGQYDNVIKEEAENAGTRTIHGIEYRLSANLKNPLSDKDLSLYGFYTYTHSVSSVSYDFNASHDSLAWVNQSAILGDIAPHKVQFGINLPIKSRINLNVKGQYIGARTPYLRNELRNSGFVFDPYLNIDAHLGIRAGVFTYGLKVKNLTNGNYFHPGPESASAGNDFENNSLGFQNSMIPQISRNYLFYIRIDY